MRAFVDTNVLVYADDAAHTDKKARAIALLEQLHRERRGVLSLQVLQEYFATAVRKLGAPPELARRKVVGFASFEVVQPRLEDLLAAIDLHRMHAFAIWDALIIRAALVARCRVLYTEDLQHGFRLDDLTVENPFLG